MPGIPHSDPRQFVQGAPVLHVANVLETAAFYRDALGFTFDFGDEHYAVVWRENAAVHFTHGTQSTGSVHLFMWVRDVDSYHAEIRSRGIEVEMEPTDQPYGIRECSLLDCNGMRIVFGQDDELI